MKILVIGGTGKVGGQVVKELQKRKADIRLLVRKGRHSDAAGRRGRDRRFAGPGLCREGNARSGQALPVERRRAR